jgi:hypothetical protein
MEATDVKVEPIELKKAGNVIRVVAKTIDFLIVAALTEAIPKIGYFAGLAYLLLGDGLFEGRSIGKRLLGLRVMLIDSGTPCTYRASALRNFVFAVAYLLMFIPFIGFVFPLAILIFEGIIMIGNEQGMRLGDELSKTHVVEET